ncbi:MAG: hypothetical protein OEW68_01045 [Gammaproteobacteria bacterium]|nr:hypothetical protein [Gammaproteobacteria bacterium]MDH4313409.1 hypothetical protein [Gammaproteobacteria bacterium]MDH5214070.1 hypothetical protein [Gammaproteobacteria bacterium]MDH5500461.1 hypothetical protein [Gammaproteobacteria bacterium]
MRKNGLLLAVSMIALAACATAGYRQVLPGVNSLGLLQITAGDGWNLASSYATPGAWPDSQTWTKDGLLLDRLVIIPAINDGEPIFKSRDKAAALPPFRANMLPNELEELTESTIVKLFGEGNAAVSTENLRPWAFAEHRGVLFDVRAAVTESPDYRGMVGAVIFDKKLYMIMFLAATPHYYDKHKADAEALIKSAAIRVPATASSGS